MYTTWTDILASLTDAELFDIITPTDGYVDEMLEAMALQELELRSLYEGQRHGTLDYDCTIPDCDDLWMGREDVWRYRKTTKLH